MKQVALAARSTAMVLCSLSIHNTGLVDGQPSRGVWPTARLWQFTQRREEHGEVSSGTIDANYIFAFQKLIDNLFFLPCPKPCGNRRPSPPLMEPNWHLPQLALDEGQRLRAVLGNVLLVRVSIISLAAVRIRRVAVALDKRRAVRRTGEA